MQTSMTAETILSEIYEALVHLQYPRITLVNSKDIESHILTGDNRIALLSWLLQQNSKFNFPLLNTLTGPALEEELFKCYCQIGICNDKDKLLGKCSLKNQLSTLRLLLVFMKNINLVPHIREDRIISNDTLQDYFDKEVNILPIDFNLSTKLTSGETNKYVEEIKNTVVDVRDLPNPQPNIKIELYQEKSANIEGIKNEKYRTNLEKFITSFDNLETESKFLIKPIGDSMVMNKTISTLESNFSVIKQTLEAKSEILKMKVPCDSQTFDTPLMKVIDESVFWLQRVSNIQIEKADS